MIKIGIIGGSGMDDPKLLKEAKKLEVETEYGKPSSDLVCGTISGVEAVVLARHGRDHSIWPTGVNYRANIRALKKVGCTHILATTAVGSLRKNIEPGDIVIPDQFIDFTKHRYLSFYDKKVVHTSMADPFCGYLCELLCKTTKELGCRCHNSATVVTIEGPRFSTRAESFMFRALGADIINMSTVPEVILAREAKICYSVIAMSTDYDCWKLDEEPVTWDIIKMRMSENVSRVKELIKEVVKGINYTDCSCTK